MILAQIALALVITSLTFGPIGRLSSGGVPVVDLVIISIWAFSWFTARNQALRYAIILGLMIDFIDFAVFGVWSAKLIATSMLIFWFKQRFAELSSPALAILSLAGISLLNYLADSFIFNSPNPTLILMTTTANVVAATIIFYVLAIRFNFLQKWLGRQI